MKTLLCVLTALFMGMGSLYAQSLKPIKLNAPNKDRGSAIMKALADRRSEREFADKKLSLQDLSDLLWAANGVNRPDGKRTAASALNKQDISIYAIMEEGSYLYDAKTHQLTPVASGDFRPLIGGQQTFVNKAPLCLLMVSDISLFGGGERAKITAALDAGIVSQNIKEINQGTISHKKDKERCAQVSGRLTRHIFLHNNKKHSIQPFYASDLYLNIHPLYLRERIHFHSGTTSDTQASQRCPGSCLLNLHHMRPFFSPVVWFK